MAQMNLLEGIRDALIHEMDHDDRVFAFGEDVGKMGGVFKVTDGLQKRFGEVRVFDTPLAESSIVGAAVGMAMAGMRPVAEIQFAGFIYPALDALFSQACKIRFRSRGRYSAPLVVRAPCGGLVKAPEQHSDSPESYLAHTPGLKVVVPSTPADAKGLLISSIRDPDPVIFLEPIRLYRLVKGEVPEGDHTVPLGRLRVVREGSDVTLVAWGAMVHTCEQAAASLEAEGVSVELLDLRSIVPLDESGILDSVRKTGRLVVAHEAPERAGFGAEVAALVAEHAIDHLLAPVRRVTAWDAPYPTFAMLEEYYFPGADRVRAAIRDVVRWR